VPAAKTVTPKHMIKMQKIFSYELTALMSPKPTVENVVIMK